MENRARLIPAISKSLTPILQKSNNKTQQTLTNLGRSQSKTDDVYDDTDLDAANQEATTSSTHHTPTTTTTYTRTTIKTSLWKIMQRDLFDPKACKKLSSLEKSVDNIYISNDDRVFHESQVDRPLMETSSDIDGGNSFFHDSESESEEYLAIDEDKNVEVQSLITTFSDSLDRAGSDEVLLFDEDIDRAPGE